MATQNFEILHFEKSCDEEKDKILISKAKAGSFFSSPCFLSEFEEEEDSFKI
jgi:hypothetical protein